MTQPGTIIVTGPIRGTVVVEGKVVDVTPDLIVVDDHDTALAVAKAIDEAHYESGYLTRPEE